MLLVIIAPMYEEFVLRALIMAWLEKYQSLYMDVLVSASLFALLHISEKQNESVIQMSCIFY
ncbi:CPBP family intramembrane glutamic endopeptidase [Streptococcus gallinaceus]|uniref:CPBP family intramembrane glutamic endopeptidase n=1 Tax=Streptococcus gallinaceus TaxID=165758 RepID=UPI00339130B1